MAAAPSAVVPDFLKAYSARLATLNSTDRGLISSLTQLAEEHRTSSGEVVKAIETRFPQLASGDHRLPLIYLIDSLLQNLGRKGFDYPKRFDRVILPMLTSTMKRASKKVQGSIYRMWNVWRNHKVFRPERIDELEAMLDSFMTQEERAAALDRPSKANAEGDPRKRAAAAAAVPAADKLGAEQPAAKRSMHQDPRLKAAVQPTPAAGVGFPLPTSHLPPLPPVVPLAPVVPAPSDDLTQLLGVLSSPEITSRPDLQPLVHRIRADIARPLPPIEMTGLIAAAAQTLIRALNQPPQLVPTPTPFAQPAKQQLPLPPQPQSRGWTPMAAPQTMPPSQPAGPPRTAKQLQQEALGNLPLTFSELDLKTPHPGVADLLYQGIKCKQCGRRMHGQPQMAVHLDWHYRMSKRKKLIEETGGSAQSQQWYWEEWEWIQADDVIFGVQTRAGEKPANKSTKKDAGQTRGASSSESKEEGPKYTPQSIIADDAQRNCLMCGEEFVREWSDPDEDWMYRNCLRLTAADAAASVVELERLLALPAPEPAEAGSAQAVAAASKEDDRQNEIWRHQQILKHVEMYGGRILHQACHHGKMNSIAKSKRPAPSPTPLAAAVLPSADTPMATEPTFPLPQQQQPPPLDTSSAAASTHQPMEEEDEEDDEEDGVNIVLDAPMKQDEP